MPKKTQFLTEFFVDGRVSDQLRNEVTNLERNVNKLGPAFESEVARMERSAERGGRGLGRRFDPFGRAYAKQFAKMEQLKAGQSYQVTAAVIKQRKALEGLYKQQERLGRSNDKLDWQIRQTGRALKEAKRAAQEHGISIRQVQGRYDGYVRQLNRAERSVRRLAIAERAVKGTGMMIGRGLDRLGGRYAALATGVAGVGAARYVGNLEERVTRLGLAFSLTGEQTKKLKEDVFAIAQEKNIRVAPERLFDAVAKIADKTGDLKFVTKENLQTLGMALQATGAEGEDLAAIFTELEKFGFKGWEEFRKNLDLLIAQGKTGSFTLQNMASQGERVASAMVFLGQGTKQGYKEMGAMLQVFRKATGSPEQAATVLEALARQLWKKSDQIKKELKVRVTELSTETGQKVIRPLPKILMEIWEATKGDMEAVAKFFDENALKGIAAFVDPVNQETFKKAMAVIGDGSTILKDSAIAAETANAAFTNIQTAFKQFSDQKMSGPVKELAELLNSMKPEQAQEILSAIAVGGGVAGLAILGRKGFKIGASLIGFLKGRSGGELSQALTQAAGGGGMTGAGLPGLTGGGATPVRVVNWPAGMGPGGVKGGRVGSFLKNIGKGALVVGAAGISIGGLFIPWAAMGALVYYLTTPEDVKRGLDLETKQAQKRSGFDFDLRPPSNLTKQELEMWRNPDIYFKHHPNQSGEDYLNWRKGLTTKNINITVNQNNNFNSLPTGIMPPEFEEALGELPRETAEEIITELTRAEKWR